METPVQGEGRCKESWEQQGSNQSPSLSRLDKHCEDIFLILVLRSRQVLPSGFAIAVSCVLWDIRGFLQCCLAAEAADLTADFCVIGAFSPPVQRWVFPFCGVTPLS